MNVVRRRASNLHLPRCVYQKHGAFWYVKAKKWTRLGDTLDEALEVYARLYEDPQAGEMPALIDAAMEALRARQSPALSPKTLKSYMSAAVLLKRKLAEFNPADVTGLDIRGIKRALADKPGMWNHCLSVLRAAFELALESELPGVTHNPAKSVTANPHNERERLIRHEEYDAIYAEADPQLQVIMDLAIRTGQRIGAILRIERANLLPEGIRFPRFKGDLKGIIAWTPELHEIIERAQQLRGAVRSIRWLLVSSQDPGEHAAYNSVHRHWQAACAAAGIEDANIHDLRAFAAVEIEEQGGDPTALLLHANRKTTEIYLRKKREKVVQGPVYEGKKKGSN